MQPPVRVRFPWEGNPHYPLPSNYTALDAEGRRLARINATRQWLIPYNSPYRPPDLTPRDFAAFLRWESLNFFDRYYLQPDPQSGFDPLFYRTTFYPSPQFHRIAVGMWAHSRMSAMCCPRGSSKTTLFKKDTLLTSITRPGYLQEYATSTNDNAENVGNDLRLAAYENLRIFDDFAPEPEFGGSIKPKRGEGFAGAQNFQLNNLSSIRCTSCESRSRGKRPHIFRLDDPEYDAKASTDTSQLRQNLLNYIQHVVLPMVMQDDASVAWVGTFVSKKHLLWKVLEQTETPDGPRAILPEFDHWDRYLVTAIEKDPVTGEERSCWPEKWPLTPPPSEDGSTGLTRHSRVSLREMESILTSRVFNAEFLGRPDDPGTNFFPSLTETLHGYSITSVDDAFTHDPRRSQSLITFHRHTPNALPTPHTLPLSTFLTECRLFLTIDHALTTNASSDLKSFSCLAHHPLSNELFVLDHHASRLPDKNFIGALFKCVDRWQIPILSPESVPNSQGFIGDLRDLIHTRAVNLVGGGFIPSLQPHHPSLKEPKEQKIASLLVRFEHGLIKFPWWLRTSPMWRDLFDQITEFKGPEVDGGGLSHDDSLDTLAMSKYVLKGRRSSHPTTPEITDPLLLLAQGTHSINGVNLTNGLNWDLVPLETIHAIMHSATLRRETQARLNPPRSFF